ncbi:shikimate 5-dehydrogenase [Thermocrinis albus DSM 14484]|uniref:Shikimate dehydrogenase (NADP(+)) n=1 Tax=Thermocrinis albus (strain DSM 14484 / JCM 11386 / HI 11/12) TaxID=638303 RepID=D3SLH7_THEAH|nr:shikimate dehydrogenase [Thermocrinis albus]ADC89607.1 shikimate 5-dehydrogenase [Thermocrinis albus DSM 14484]
MLLYGLIGYPVSHSLSPVFQNFALRYLGVDAIYVPFEVKPEDLSEAIKGLKVLGVRGVNVTIPHKERVLDLVDWMDHHTEVIGAANTLLLEDGIIKAYNTDWIGFLKSLWDMQLSKGKALLLGAGGSSRAVAYALRQEGWEVYLWNRTKEKAVSLAERFQLQVVDRPEEVVKHVDLIVNTTPSEEPLFDYQLIDSHHSILDIIYYRETALIRRAKEVGAKYSDGLPMLLYQGLESLRIWTGCSVPYKLVLESVRQHKIR